VRNEVGEIRHSRASFLQRTLYGYRRKFRICVTGSGTLEPLVKRPADVARRNPQPVAKRAPATPYVYGEAAHESFEELVGGQRLPG
jgi:hypothetical protein